MRDMKSGLLDGRLDRAIVFAFDRSGFARHARRFHVRDRAVDLSGRVRLVTGANSGIGLATATALAARAAAREQLWRTCTLLARLGQGSAAARSVHA